MKFPRKQAGKHIRESIEKITGSPDNRANP